MTTILKGSQAAVLKCIFTNLTNEILQASCLPAFNWYMLGLLKNGSSTFLTGAARGWERRPSARCGQRRTWPRQPPKDLTSSLAVRCPSLTACIISMGNFPTPSQTPSPGQGWEWALAGADMNYPKESSCSPFHWQGKGLTKAKCPLVCAEIMQLIPGILRI